MSAIWGIINKNANTNLEDLHNKMETSMSVFSFDRIDTIRTKKGIITCGHQYITTEDEHDVSPIRDEKGNLIFCSDCFLYNRNNLIEELKDPNLVNEGDSLIAYKAFKKWGFSFVQKLRGVFSFAIYEEDKDCLHLFSDHFSRKYVVYHIEHDHIYFSTTYKPILACLEKRVKINHEFIANSFSDITPRNFHKERITPFENVFHIEYATHLTFDLTTGHISNERYWNPIKTVKKLKLKSDEEYKSAFRELFENLTRSMLRSKNETGITLSGGLDSSSVAAFASKILKERGKALNCYTQVPSSDYVDDENDPYSTVNEKPLVELQKKFHGNLITHYISGDNDCCISHIDQFQNLFDMPIKASLNLINIMNMNKAAQKDNCSILLSGGNGNATISYGYLTYCMSIYVSKLHFLKAYKEMSAFCKRYHSSRKKYLKTWLKSMFNYYFIKPKEDHFFLKPEDEKKYKLTHPRYDSHRASGSDSFCTEKQKNKFLVNPAYFSQKGFFYTTTELTSHFIMMDPSYTVEMTEFCLSLPLECFCHNGIERRLVRDYLKDLLPEAITDMRKPFGIQTADYYYRINRDIDNLKEEVFRNLDEPLLREYLDAEKIDPLIRELKSAAETHTLDRKQSIKLSQLVYLGSFLRNHTYH